MTDTKKEKAGVAVILPCYKSREHILKVIAEIGEEVSHILVVDDACPLQTGKYVEQNCSDPRLVVLFHDENRGVGGAVKTGYRYVLDNRIDYAVKIDSDGQMSPALIPDFLEPLVERRADYTKGNRFFRSGDLAQMPIHRVIGNAGLSFLNKIASGYWKIFDPTNGYTAISHRALQELQLQYIDDRYFFESDMLYHLSLNRCVVRDIPMTALYGDEKSGLSAGRNMLPFFFKMIRNSIKRIIYRYYLRDFSIASLELFLGLILTLSGSSWGLWKWYQGTVTGIPATGGQVMLAALPIIVGVQMLVSFLNYDIVSEPR